MTSLSLVASSIFQQEINDSLSKQQSTLYLKQAINATHYSIDLHSI